MTPMTERRAEPVTTARTKRWWYGCVAPEPPYATYRIVDSMVESEAGELDAGAVRRGRQSVLVHDDLCRQPQLDLSADL